jgi:Esterase-like activity of phytase/Secretion system C-terminal sorting domain
MRRFFTRLKLLSAMVILTGTVIVNAQTLPNPSCNFLQRIGGVASTIGAEIPAFDPESKRVYSVAGSVIEYFTMSNTGTLTLGGTLPIGFTLASGTNALPNSVAVSNGIVAASFAIVNATTNAQLPGRVTFYNAATGAVLNSVETGYLPDMVTFTADGKKLLTANEGEPNSYGQATSFDPEGSVSIIDISTGATTAIVQTVSFASFNSQAAALRLLGVRIYGPGASVAQDLEPEYIAISPDGTKAWVTLQENNAFAVVDIATATVTSILPLGFKDHSAVAVSSFNSYQFTNLPVLGTTLGGQNINLGGFSGLHFEGYAANGNLKFVTNTDRGPNGEPVSDKRPFLLPAFAPEIVRFELNPANGVINITQRIQLQNPTLNLLTGLPNTAIAGNTSTPFNDEAPINLLNASLPLDPLGGDLEGVVVAPDGTFWMVDEYRPAIYQFSSTGVMLKRYVPQGTAAAAGQPAGTFGTEVLPAVIGQRRQNRGFEGIALQNGKVYAFVQSPIRNPASLSNATLNNSRNIRIVELDPVTETTRQFLYIMDNPNLGGATNTRPDKIGDAVAFTNGQFLVVERDDDAIDSDPLELIEKKVYRFNLGGATDISAFSGLVALPGGGSKTIDQMTTAELASVNIVPIQKFLHVDLAKAGYNTNEKVEGLALISPDSIAVINDNDFNVGASPIDFTTGTFGPSPNIEPIVLGIIKTKALNPLDASDRDVNFPNSGSAGKINIQSWPVFGMYQPDAIAQYTVGGQTYYITANEGDARDYTGYSEERRVGATGATPYNLDPTAFPNATALKLNQNLGRLTSTIAGGDLDGDGDFDRIQILGARSFSIWNSSGALVYDSKDQMEVITSLLTPATFNSDGPAASFDTRSDNKGPEPEGVVIGEINGVPYAFIGLERVGDILVYNVSNPSAPVFVQYINTPEDNGVEGLTFVSAANSPTGKPLVITTAEVSRTISVYEVNIPTITVAETSGLSNNDGTICTGASVTLTSTGSAPYLWSTGETTASISVSPASTTSYTVTSCYLQASTTITVNPVNKCSITAVPSSDVYTGGVVTNLYLGYGPQQLTLSTTADASGAPYTYAWSGGALSNYNTANPVFTATTAGSFTFTCTITNQFGCVSTCSITVCVTDIRVPGTNGKKVYVCHAPPGNPSNTKTLEISVNAVAAHLRNQPDSRLGKCGETPCGNKVAGRFSNEIITGTLMLKALPNPTSNSFTLQLQSDKSETAEIRVLDMQGRTVFSKRVAANSFVNFGNEFVSGIYLLEVKQGAETKTMKLVKQ